MLFLVEILRLRHIQIQALPKACCNLWNKICIISRPTAWYAFPENLNNLKTLQKSK